MTTLTFDESSRTITRIVRLQVLLLDHTGHVNRGLSRDDCKMYVGEINHERARVGWKPLEMTGRYRRGTRASQ